MSVATVKLFRIFFVWLLIVMFAPFGAAQETTTDTTDTRKTGWLVLPFAYYTPETKLAFGIGGLFLFHTMKQTKFRSPSMIAGSLTYTTNKQYLLEVTPQIYFDDGNILGKLLIQAGDFPIKFYGTGNSAPKSNEEYYTSRYYNIELELMRRIQEQLRVGIVWQLRNNAVSETKPGGILETGNVTGSRGGVISGFGIIAQQDTRNFRFNATAGSYYQLKALFYQKSFGSDFIFSYLQADLRKFIQFDEKRSAAFSFYAQFMNGEVPFDRLSKLGGASYMRGYFEGRYRDNQYVSLQAEYRQQLFWRIGAVAFAGFGDVAHSFSDFSLKSIKPSYGLGVRFLLNEDEQLNVRFDYAFGKDSHGFYIQAGEAF